MSETHRSWGSVGFILPKRRAPTSRLGQRVNTHYIQRCCMRNQCEFGKLHNINLLDLNNGIMISRNGHDMGPLSYVVFLRVPGTTDNILHQIKKHVRPHYDKSSWRNAHILLIPTFPKETMRDIPQIEEQSSSVCCYQGMTRWGAKTKQFVVIQNELIFCEASWEYSF